MSKLTNALMGATLALGGFLPAAYAQTSPGGTVSGQPPTPQSELRRSLPPDIEVDRSIRSRVTPRATPRVPPPPTQTVIPRGDAYWDDYWRWYNNDYSRNYTRFQRASENSELDTSAVGEIASADPTLLSDPRLWGDAALGSRFGGTASSPVRHRAADIRLRRTTAGDGELEVGAWFLKTSSG